MPCRYLAQFSVALQIGSDWTQFSLANQSIIDVQTGAKVAVISDPNAAFNAPRGISPNVTTIKDFGGMAYYNRCTRQGRLTECFKIRKYITMPNRVGRLYFTNIFSMLYHSI